ncbi:MAG: GC-type dockerin domain-anchored protein [Planctomycetota bacterium]
MQPQNIACTLTVILFASAPATANGQVIRLMPELPGALIQPFPNSVSDDGRYVSATGFVASGRRAAIRWDTQTGQLLDLAATPIPGSVGLDTYAISADGSVIVGRSYTGGPDSQPFHWSESSGMTLIPGLPGGGFSTAIAVSADGNVVACESNDAIGQTGFRWTPGGAGGAEQLIREAPDSIDEVWGISRDGNVILGRSSSSLAGTRNGAGWVGSPPDPVIISNPDDARSVVFTDGSQDAEGVVGFAEFPAGYSQALLFFDGDFMFLDDPGAGEAGTRAVACDANASVIIGHRVETQTNFPDSLVWIDAAPAQTLRELLDARGVKLPSEYMLYGARGISGDGRFITAGLETLSGAFAGVLIDLSATVCSPADVTSTGATLSGQRGYGIPDNTVDLDDLGYFLNAWLGGDVTIADFTTTGATLEGQPGFGTSDGDVDLDDLGYFLNFWLTGCP